MKKVKYTIIESAKEPIDTLIEKTGVQDVSVKFTLADLVAEIKKIQSLIREREAEQKIHIAEMKNVEMQHPAVKDLSIELKQAAYVHMEAKINYEVSKETQTNYGVALKDSLKELAKVCRDLNMPQPVV